MSNIQFEKLHADFGARVYGIDLSESLSGENITAISNAMDEYSILCFPNQHMTDEVHLSLTNALGEPELNHVIFGATGKLEYFGVIGNVIDAKNKKGNEDPHTHFQSGNNLWHSDSSFSLVPAKFSIMHAYEVPGEGGITEYASQRVGYASLPSKLQTKIDPLHVLHDFLFSRSQVAPVDPNHAASLPPIEHKLVRTNPKNLQKNFYVGSHARSIINYSGLESRRLIDDLLEYATVPEKVYAHQWQVGDTAIWDNRCLLHRGLGYDADRWRRLMKQTRVSGDCPSLDE
jgi:alpha-ketoglutarate-dependent 2,4-dichlorophenoxyacetate dioxygenase